MTPLKILLKNKILLQKNHNYNMGYIDKMAFFELQEHINIANEIEEEQREREGNNEQQNNFNVPNINTSEMTNKMNSMLSKFK